MNRNRASWIAVAMLCLAADAALIGPALWTEDVRAPGDILVGSAPWRDEHPDAPARAHNPMLSDWVLQFHPWRRLVVESWSAGRPPLWNELAGAGQPLLANTQCEALSPYLPVALLAGDQQPDWKQLAQLLLAQLLCLGLARSLDLGPLAASVLALGYPLCSYMQLWTMHPHSGTAAFAPGILWALLALRARPDARRFSLVAAVVGLAILAGHLETALLAALGAGAVAVAAPSRSGAGRPRFVGLAVLAGLAGTLLAAATVLPFLEYLANSDVRAFRAATRAAQGHAALPLDHLATLLDPLALGGPRDWRGSANLVEAGFHVGRVLLGLAAAGLLGAVFDPRRRGLALAVAATAALALLATYESPLARLLRALPLLEILPLERLWFCAQLPLAILAALGLERARQGSAAAALGAVAVAIVAALAAGAGALGGESLGWLVGGSGLVIALVAFHSLGIRVVLAACLPLAVAADGLRSWRDWVPTVPASWIAPSSEAMDALAASVEEGRALSVSLLAKPNTPALHGVRSLRAYDAVGLRRPFRALLAARCCENLGGSQRIVSAPPALLDALGVSRVLSAWPAEDAPRLADEFVVTPRAPLEAPLTLGPESPLEFVVERLPGATGEMRARLEILAEGAEVPMVARLGGGGFEQVSGEDPAGRFAVDRDRALRELLRSIGMDDDPYLRFSCGAAELRATARLVVPPGAPSLVLRSIRRRGLGATREISRPGRLHLSARPTALPLAYLAPSPREVGGVDAAVSELLAEGFDPHSETLVEWRGAKPSWWRASEPGSAAAEPLSVPVERAAPESMSLLVEAPRPGLLVVSESWAPGWKARVEGEAVPVHVANGLVLAIPVPAGPSRVTLEYRPLSWVFGLVLSAAALLGLILAASLPAREARVRIP